MEISESFLAPAYYPAFSCKCGDCRATCCHGWNITLSMDDYFRVTGQDCSPELRRKLDVAFRPAENPAPTPDRYMMISYNWLGQCPLQREDGYCALHRECGEDAIPEICRRFPRAIRLQPIPEACTSTSCERTIELLLTNDEPFKTTDITLTLRENTFDDSHAASADPDAYRELRQKVFAILADRTHSLDERLGMIGKTVGAQAVPQFTDAQAAALAGRLARTSDALAELSAECGNAVIDCPESLTLYLEKILANHIFYKAFPHSFEKSTANEEMTSLAAVLALMRHFARLDSAGEWDLTRFIDRMAKLFRPIEHSRFDETVVKIVKYL